MRVDGPQLRLHESYFIDLIQTGTCHYAAVKYIRSLREVFSF